MGFFDFLNPTGDEFLGGLFSSDDGGLGGGLVNASLQAADYIDNEFQAPAPMNVSYAVPTARTIPSGGMPALLPSSMVTRGLARFPQLLASMQSWRARGVSLTVPKLLAMMKKFGPNFLVSAGIIAAGAVTELLMYQASNKRRRMNALNPRALSRATRRLCSFEHRASKVHRTLAHLSKGKRKAFC
jgi:hypothetical protein